MSESLRKWRQMEAATLGSITNTCACAYLIVEVVLQLHQTANAATVQHSDAATTTTDPH